jgi:hypothetical protein
MSETNITRIIRSALNLQDTVSKKIPQHKKEAGEGRIGKLVVDDPGDGITPGPEHTVMYFKVKDGRLTILEGKPANVRNEIIFLGAPERGYSGVDLFKDGLTQSRWYRYAWTQKWLIITNPDGDLAEYDTEEMLQVCEDLMSKVAKTVSA